MEIARAKGYLWDPPGLFSWYRLVKHPDLLDVPNLDKHHESSSQSSHTTMNPAPRAPTPCPERRIQLPELSHLTQSCPTASAGLTQRRSHARKVSLGDPPGPLGWCRAVTHPELLELPNHAQSSELQLPTHTYLAQNNESYPRGSHTCRRAPPQLPQLSHSGSPALEGFR